LSEAFVYIVANTSRTIYLRVMELIKGDSSMSSDNSDP